MVKNKRSIVLVILVLFFLSITGESHAALQSNANTYYTKKDAGTNWMKEFRNMETTGQAMGLTETINGTTLLNTTQSNGIDVHLIKSTEYGAIAILSASGYGNPQTLQASAIKTTTGNKTGVYIVGGSDTWEYSALGREGSSFQGLPGVDGRYYNTYTTNISSARVGDALGNATTANPGCYGWHSAGYGNWIGGSQYLARGSYGIFSYSPTTNDAWYGRGVAVCGTGL